MGGGPWSVSRVMPVMSVRKSTTYGRKQTSAVPISTTATVYPGMDGIGGITLSIGFTNSSSSTRHLHRVGAQLRGRTYPRRGTHAEAHNIAIDTLEY